MTTLLQWTYDTDHADWVAGFDGLLADVERLLGAGATRGLDVGGLGATTPPVVGPSLIALSGEGERLVLHRQDPAPWLPSTEAAGAGNAVTGVMDDTLPDCEGPGLGCLSLGDDEGFGVLARAVLLRASVHGRAAFHLIEQLDSTAWDQARELLRDVFGSAHDSLPTAAPT